MGAATETEVRRVCTRAHDNEEGFLEFGDKYVSSPRGVVVVKLM